MDLGLDTGHRYSKHQGLSIIMLLCIRQHVSTFEAQSTNKLSNAEAELKKNVAYKKKRLTKLFLSCYICVLERIYTMNIKKIFARKRRNILTRSDCNGIRTYNHLVRKRTLNHLVSLNNWMFVYERSGSEFKSCCSHLNLKSQQCIWLFIVMDHSVSTNAIFFEKLTFLTPWYAHVHVSIRGKEMLVFQIFTYVLNEWSLSFE